MDDMVRAALKKWPNVPACTGWLALDARGDWYMRDDRTQAAGPFVQARGSLLRHEKLVDFIHRNYDHDDAGQWFFQNGPQRVFVELEAAPFTWRIGPGASVTSHSGLPAQPRTVVLDEQGRVFLDTDIGFGLVHTLDVADVADAIEAGRWPTEDFAASDLPGRFGFVLSPAALQPHQ